jgi:hypothetical protein
VFELTWQSIFVPGIVSTAASNGVVSLDEIVLEQKIDRTHLSHESVPVSEVPNLSA